MSTLHYAVTSYLLGEYEPEEVAACGGDFRRTKKLTDDWRKVTCRHCRKLLGIEEAKAEAMRRAA